MHANKKSLWQNRGFIAPDLTASLVVFAVALPLCVAIAKASGMSTAAGIMTAIVGGVVVGAIGGGPLLVSGPTAGLITVLLASHEQLGVSSLGLVVVLAGLMQIVAGLMRIGQWFRIVSPAVILGMLAGVGAILVSQQFHVAVDDVPTNSPLANFLGMFRAVLNIFDGHPGHDGHFAAAMIGLLTLAVLVFWKRAAPKAMQSLPTTLAAIAIATTASSLLSLPIQRVEFESLSAGLTTIDATRIPSAMINPTVWQIALTIAILGSAESLLTATAVDGLHAGARTQYDRELAAQGVGNVLCGCIGALPMAGVIVRSSASLNAGARSRLATILHGVWMLAFAIILPGCLRLIPVSALASILVLTGLRLMQVSTIRKLWMESRSEGCICISVAITVVALDLLTGVLVGVALTVLKLVISVSKLNIVSRSEIGDKDVVIALEGAATFLRLPRLASVLEGVSAQANVFIDIERLTYIDHSCFLLLKTYEKQRVASGGKLELDWAALRLGDNTSQRPSRPSEDEVCDTDLNFDSRGGFRRAA